MIRGTNRHYERPSMLYNISDHKAWEYDTNHAKRNRGTKLQETESTKRDSHPYQTISHIQTLFTGKRYRHGSHTHTILSDHILIYIHLFINWTIALIRAQWYCMLEPLNALTLPLRLSVTRIVITNTSFILIRETICFEHYQIPIETHDI